MYEMNETEAKRYLNDLLRGMVYMRQHESSFNKPERHRAILKAYNEVTGI
jgi:polyhydroxyalkanoate synthesis regulator phasin